MASFAVCEEKFLYVVSQQNGQALTVSRDGAVKADTIAHPTSDQQLWHFDERGRLISKVNRTVADIDKQDTSPGATVVTVFENGGTSQVWTYEDGFLKNGKNDLVMSMTHGGSYITTQNEDPAYIQRWILVPREMLGDYERMMEDKNPITECVFYKNILVNHFWLISGCPSVEQFEKSREKSISAMQDIATTLDGWARKKGYWDVGTGVLGMASLITGPLVKLALVIKEGHVLFKGAQAFLKIPAVIQVVKRLTQADAVVQSANAMMPARTADVGHLSYEEIQRHIVENEVALIVSGCIRLQSFINEFIKNLEAAKKYIDTEEGKHYIKKAAEEKGKKESVDDKFIRWAEELVLHTFRDDIIDGVDSLIGNLIKWYSGKKAAKGAEGCGSETWATRGVSAVLWLPMVFFGFNDLKDGWDAIKNGSDLASKCRESADNLEKISKGVIGVYKNLLAILVEKC